MYGVTLLKEKLKIFQVQAVLSPCIHDDRIAINTRTYLQSLELCIQILLATIKTQMIKKTSVLSMIQAELQPQYQTATKNVTQTDALVKKPAKIGRV